MNRRERCLHSPAYRRLSLFLSVFFFCFGTAHTLFHAVSGGHEPEGLSAAALPGSGSLSGVDGAHSPEFRTGHVCPACSQPLTFFRESDPVDSPVFVRRSAGAAAFRLPVPAVDIRLPHTRGPPARS